MARGSRPAAAALAGLASIAMVVLAACGAASPGGRTAAELEAFACDPAGGGVEPVEPPAPRAPPSDDLLSGSGPVISGQMTEQAAIARRFYEAERWPEAEAALRRVWTGETGDDDGERQIAEYHLACTLYRLGRKDESLEMFSAISRAPDHLKYEETRLWLGKLATQGPPFLDRAGRALARYAARDSRAPRDVLSSRREIAWAVEHVVGRQLYRTGQYETAIVHLQRVPEQSEFHDVAQRCIALCRQRSPAAGGPGQ